jgi:hypothetical protein
MDRKLRLALPLAALLTACGHDKPKIPTRADAEKLASESNSRLPKDSCSRWIARDNGPNGWGITPDESRCQKMDLSLERQPQIPARKR